MWNWWKSRRSLCRATDRMMAARRRAEGAIAREWQLETEAAGAAVDSVVDWCRETLSGSRRPFGIDEFDLALAYSTGETVTSRLYRLRASDLYDEATTARLGAFLEDAGGSGRMAAALFSWGDAADRELPRR